MKTDARGIAVRRRMSRSVLEIHETVVIAHREHWCGGFIREVVYVAAIEARKEIGEAPGRQRHRNFLFFSFSFSPPSVSFPCCCVSLPPPVFLLLFPFLRPCAASSPLSVFTGFLTGSSGNNEAKGYFSLFPSIISILFIR